MPRPIRTEFIGKDGKRCRRMECRRNKNETVRTITDNNDAHFGRIHTEWFGALVVWDWPEMELARSCIIYTMLSLRTSLLRISRHSRAEHSAVWSSKQFRQLADAFHHFTRFTNQNLCIVSCGKISLTVFTVQLDHLPNLCRGRAGLYMSIGMTSFAGRDSSLAGECSVSVK